jgi:hypothetical protein
MGTSASNGGPKGSPPLLPDWYNDPISLPNDNSQDNEEDQSGEDQDEPQPSLNDRTDQPEEVRTGDWGKAKGALTRLSNQTGGSSRQKAGRKYINSLGGARNAAKAATQGIRVGRSYSGFLGTLSSTGLNGTLTQLGLAELIGKPAEEICSAIADALAPIGSTNDEAIARDAIITTIDTLYTRILENGGSIESLDSLTPDQIKETMLEYVSNYVFTKWMYELGSAIEKGNISEQEAIELEKEVKSLIISETTECYRDVDINYFVLNDEDSLQTITDIFETAYSILAS